MELHRDGAVTNNTVAHGLIYATRTPSGQPGRRLSALSRPTVGAELRMRMSFHPHTRMKGLALPVSETLNNVARSSSTQT